MSATSDRVQEGNVGAGAGATIGKMGGRDSSMKGGLGSASITLPNGLTVGAIVAVNAVGDVIDPDTGRVVAGMRSADGKSLVDVRKLIREGAFSRAVAPRAGENTSLAVVATNARLSKADISRVAIMADDGLARAIAPSHTVGDGDTVFSLATGRWSAKRTRPSLAHSPPTSSPKRLSGPSRKPRSSGGCRRRAISAPCPRATANEHSSAQASPSPL
jgi:L-aminopeptidase/D-esterase-like protein